MGTKAKLKQFWGFLLAAVMVCTVVVVPPKTTFAVTNADMTAANEYGLMEDVQDGVILHCWDWSFNNMKAQMAEIAAAGYTAIQTSPIQAAKESTLGQTNDAWWVFYQPKSFEIDNSGQSALGTKAEFEAMCEEAHKYGIKVIVDVVANHLGNNRGHDKANTIADDIKNDSSCWHDTWNVEINYGDRYSITHGSMGGLPDLNTESSKIQNYVLGFLKECIDAGADGFRFDAAKHISVREEGEQYTFWENTLEKAKVYAKESRGLDLYAYGEILYGTDGPSIGGYTQYMSVTENASSNGIRDAVVSGNAAGAANSYYSKGAPANKLVMWAESHDTYSNDSKESTNISTTDINKTWALVASRADATALYFARTNGYRAGKIGQIGTYDWKNKEVAAVNKFHNFFNGESEYLASSGSIAYNERGTSGVVLVNCGGTTASVNVKANKMADGTYKDQITGNTFTVSNGYIKGQIGSTGIAVVYNEEYKPVATISVPGGVFSSDTLTVSIGLKNATSGTYKIGTANAVTYTSAKDITIGNGMNIGDSINVVLTATDGKTNSTATYTFTKVEKSNNVAYIKLPAGWSSSVYCYVYDELSAISNGDFPGELMTYDSSLGYYKYEIPENITKPRVIFYNSDTNRYPADQEEGLVCTGENIYINGVWKPYTGPVVLEPVYDRGVYYDNTEGWSSVYVYYWNDSGNNHEWPGELMTQLDNGYYAKNIGNFEPEFIIFSNGEKAQTDDLDFVLNGLYNFGGFQKVVTKQEEKLNGLAKGDDNNWYYYVNGEVDTTFTGMIEHENDVWYIKNGKFVSTYTGMYIYEGKWIYVKDGKFDSSYTGMAKNSSGWWYMKNGVLDRTYTGMAKNSYGVWYMKDGKLDQTYTGMYIYEGKWIYVNKGQFDKKYTGMAKNSSGWWYMKNGVLDRTYTGMVAYGDEVWYVKAGKFNTSYTGMYTYDGKWIYVKNGKYDSSYTGMAKNSYGVWYMKAGNLDRSYTGMYIYDGKWVYVNKGKYDTSYTGIAKNSAGWWYMKNGVLDRTYNGKVVYAGKTYTVTNGKVAK